MTKKSLHFWVLLVASLILATLVLSLALKIVKLVFILLLMLVLTPVIYGILKSLTASDKLNNRSEKLKRRD
jgi:multisubunit Na+/H+ antiporter MnhG subunit